MEGYLQYYDLKPMNIYSIFSNAALVHSDTFVNVINKISLHLPTPPGFPFTNPTVSKVESFEAMKLKASFFETLVSGVPKRRNVGAPSPFENG